MKKGIPDNHNNQPMAMATASPPSSSSSSVPLSPVPDVSPDFLAASPPVSPPAPEFYKRKDLAARLGVSTQTIRIWERQRRLTPIRINARVIRYRAADVQALLNAGLA